MNADVEKRVFKVISQVMGVSLAEVDENASPDTIGTWDSLKHMNLILALEQEFGVQFTDRQIIEMISAKLISLELESMVK
jgi:acyl carrier protein